MAKVFADQFGLESYKVVRVDLEKQILESPVFDDFQWNHAWFEAFQEDSNFGLSRCYLYGNMDVDAKHVRVGNHTFPWGEDVKERPKNGKQNIKIKLKGWFDSEQPVIESWSYFDATVPY